MRRPTQEELAAAVDKEVPDVIAPGLKVLFCGFNPGLYSGAVGHHFARPGNRFWPTLFAAGITPRRLRPEEEQELLTYGYGITNMVERATARADELTAAELQQGAERLAEKVRHYRPHAVAILGIGAYRTAFGEKDVQVGRQTRDLAGAELWVLPNPSGLNAHYQLEDLARLYSELRHAGEEREQSAG